MCGGRLHRSPRTDLVKPLWLQTLGTIIRTSGQSSTVFMMPSTASTAASLFSLSGEQNCDRQHGGVKVEGTLETDNLNTTWGQFRFLVASIHPSSTEHFVILKAVFRFVRCHGPFPPQLMFLEKMEIKIFVLCNSLTREPSFLFHECSPRLSPQTLNHRHPRSLGSSDQPGKVAVLTS